MISNTTKYLIVAITGVVFVVLVMGSSIYFALEHSISSIPYDYTILRRTNELKQEIIKGKIVEEIDNYIHKIAPSSCLNALPLFEACEESNIDIIFVLAQGQIESHFGTRGIAAKTNSVFNVYSYDGLSAEEVIKQGKRYKHPDNSIMPYLILLNNKYLINNKTEKDMFIDFVDENGRRYASAEDYEEKLLNIYIKIDSLTNISSLYKEYKKYKIINEK